MIACFAMTVFTCFVLQGAKVEGNFSVLSNQDNQFVDLLLSEKLAMMLLQQWLVQTKSARDWLGMKLLSATQFFWKRG